jgi:NTP pyrophosphatase (non-canonical NTP hydrolase)
MPVDYKELNLEITSLVLSDVTIERINQFEQWGNQEHTWGEWLAILGEEFGEVCQAIQTLMGLISTKPTDAADLYKELIQLAAVAVQIAEIIRKIEGMMKYGETD